MGIMGSFINKTIVFFVCLFLLSGCFPSFRPQKKVRCRINVKNGTFVLVDYVGTLDRDFPSEVYFVRDKDSVLVHKGYRTKKMSVKDNTRPLQNLTPFSIILVFEHYWLTCSLYF